MSSSDYRSTQQTTTNELPNITEKMTAKVSYAQITQQTTFPTKEQAIVLDAIDGITIKEYTIAIGNIIGPNNIRFVSRISNGRVCIYCSNQEIVDKLINSHTKIKINSQILEIRPLISKTKRVILSNVCPIIPHSVIETKISEIKIKPASQITFIRAGIKDPGYTHILSFRRQFYIQPEDVDKLPEHIQIIFDNTEYWIYISTDNITCFICKEVGHLAKHCHTTNIQSTDTMKTKTYPSIITTPESPSTNIPSNEINNTESKEIQDRRDTVTLNTDSSLDDKINSPNTSGIKRNRSEASLSSEATAVPSKLSQFHVTENTESNMNTSTSTSKLNKKKTKLASSIDINLFPESVKEHVINTGYPLNLEQFKNFLQQTYGHPKTMELAKNFTEDIPALIKMLQNTYIHFNERSIKNRITRIIKRLQNPVPDFDSSTEDQNMEDHI